MCGIDGLLRLTADAPPLDLAALRATRERQAQRGPDGAGEWVSEDRTVALGHRRLAILDLSTSGLQPMATADGRHHVVVNGEIYNYRELRAELAAKGHQFSSSGDIAVLLELYARHGLDAFARLRGMFALALWDEPHRRLVLARDPHGIKPLYYAADGQTLRFASQVKALEAGGLDQALDPAAVVGFLLWGSVPEPFTIRQAASALPPGHLLVVENGRVASPRSFVASDIGTLDRGFGSTDPGNPADPGPTTPSYSGSLQQLDYVAGSARDAVTSSIAAHLVADVPVATFLSGGLDSTVLTAVAARYLPNPPQTFTLRFDRLLGTSADEGPLAARIARLLGCPHQERILGAADVGNLWHDATTAMDQPSIDGFNTFLVSRAAHQAGIKVALSGVGGDELFGSYPSFRDVPRLCSLARRLARLPALDRLWPAAAGHLGTRPKLAGLLRYGQGLAGAYFLRRGLYLPEELPELLDGELLRAGLERLAGVGVGAAAEVAAVALGRPAPHQKPAPESDPWRLVQHLESTSYLRNQLLRDGDWASMASSLELRTPFVDATLSRALAVVDFAPARHIGKANFLRQLAPELPAELFARRKHGFTIPLVEWLDPATAAARPGQRSRVLAGKVLGLWTG